MNQALFRDQGQVQAQGVFLRKCRALFCWGLRKWEAEAEMPSSYVPFGAPGLETSSLALKTVLLES